MRIFPFPAIMALLLAVSCTTGGDSGHTTQGGDTIELAYADNFTMVDYGDYLKADFRNPWDTTRTLQTVLLVPRDKPMPADMPAGTVVRVPLERSVVYTSVHNSLIDELGAIDGVVGVCDAQYISREGVRKRIDSGKIADCGQGMAPNVEKILMLRPDAILLSAFENSNDHNKVAHTGVPVIDCTDYMETSPLGRAEWMRFYGRLYGKGEQADSLFAATEKSYNTVKQAAAGASTRPVVLTEMIYGGTWDVPGAYSTAGVLVEDAGGRNPFDEYKKSGSIKLAPEQVLFKAGNADFWLVKYASATPLTLTQLAADNPVYSKIKAYKTGNVYGIDTNRSSYFEDAAFHPDWVLAEYVNLFHPELGIEMRHHAYYQKVEGKR